MITGGQKRAELTLYGVLWAVLFAAPVLSMYVGGQSSHTATHDMQVMYRTWEILSVFLSMFLIHNFLLSPVLVYGNKKWHYFSLTAVLMACFVVFQMHSISLDRPPEKRPPMERHEGGRRNAEPPRAKKGHPVPLMPRPDDDGRHKHEPPQPFGGEEMVSFIIMILLLGLNNGVKYFFKTASDRKRMKELERENLRQQMEYLRYQVNPHFFMNTLNNIHALVDFDPEKAKYTIEVLSKLMRYMLYEGNRQTVPLADELAFVRRYVEIMRIRYTDKVEITMSIPEHTPDVTIPPLIFIIFVENAFKHGVSYQRQSFISLSVNVTDSEIRFCCRNSRKPKAEDTHGGVGLQNVRERLRLIYGSDYTLCISPSAEEYLVELSLPLTNSKTETT